MIEVIAGLARWLQLASNMILIGGCVFFAIAGSERAAFDNPWLARLQRSFPWLSVTLLLGLLGLLATTTAEATGATENAWSLARIPAEDPQRVHLDCTCSPCARRARDSSLRSDFSECTMALCAGRDGGRGGLRRIGIPAALAACALAVALPPLAVEAYPETYRKTPVPFDSISIAKGITVFAANCVPCHGPQAKGEASWPRPCLGSRSIFSRSRIRPCIPQAFFSIG